MPGAHSIERLFHRIRLALPPEFTVDVVRCPTPYHTRAWIVQGLRLAGHHNTGICHITGDVHYLALRLPKARTVLTVHDLYRLEHLRGLRRILYSWLYFALPLRRCRYVTAISEETRDRLVRRFPFVSSKIAVIPDCVPDGFAPQPKRLDPSCPRILQVGTAAHKNLERVVRALEGLSCILHIVGPLNRDQRAQLDACRIRFENEVNLSDAALVQAYQEADIVVFASLAEGFGLPILEAQAVGRPLVTSDREPMRSVSGGAAALVDPERPEAIRSAVLRIVQEESYRNDLVSGGFKNVGRFEPAAVAAAYAGLYRRMTRGTAR